MGADKWAVGSAAALSHLPSSPALPLVDGRHRWTNERLRRRSLCGRTKQFGGFSTNCFWGVRITAEFGGGDWSQWQIGAGMEQTSQEFINKGINFSRINPYICTHTYKCDSVVSLPNIWFGLIIISVYKGERFMSGRVVKHTVKTRTTSKTKSERSKSPWYNYLYMLLWDKWRKILIIYNVYVYFRDEANCWETSVSALGRR